jgi:hypothetical protein
MYKSTYQRNHNARPHIFLLSPRALQNPPLHYITGVNTTNLHKLKLQLPTYTEENTKCKSTTVGLLGFLLATDSRNKPTKNALGFGYVCG